MSGIRRAMPFVHLPQTPEGMPLPPLKSFLTDPGRRLKAIQDLQTGEKDILLNSYPKSGSHWVHEILSKLLYDEHTQTRMEDGFLDFVNDFSSLSSLPSPRLLYTHLPAQYLPQDHVKKGRKIIHIVRDPRDIAVSAYHHFLNVPQFERFFTRDWDEHLANFMSGNFIYGEWFNYELKYETFAKTNNVMMLIYEEMKMDEEKAVRNIADYLETPCTPAKAAKIASECSFSQVQERRKSGQFAFLFRKGDVGDWRNYFSGAQEEKFTLLFREKMKNSDLMKYYSKINSKM
ncbi:sulfotransferase 6B1-like [Crassostrea virginica]